MTERRSPLLRPELRDAIRRGDKTMTRRVVKPQPYCPGGRMFRHGGTATWGFRPVYFNPHDELMRLFKPPHGQPGDVWALCEPLFKCCGAALYADDAAVIDRRTGTMPLVWQKANGKPYKRDTLSSMHMPVYAARDFTTLQAVRVERLQDISDEDVVAEGIDIGKAPYRPEDHMNRDFDTDFETAFRDLWDSINGKKHPWESNPFVWVYEFGDYQREPGRTMP